MDRSAAPIAVDTGVPGLADDAYRCLRIDTETGEVVAQFDVQAAGGRVVLNDLMIAGDAAIIIRPH